MTAHVIAAAQLEDRDYAVVSRGRVLVAGKYSIGFRLGYLPAGREGRRTFQGPMVPGPWGWLTAEAACIDLRGGSGREIADERAAGLLIEAEVGDLLVLPDVTFRIVDDTNVPRNRDYASVEVVEAPTPSHRMTAAAFARLEAQGYASTGDDGARRVLVLDETTGATCLEPVEIVEQVR